MVLSLIETKDLSIVEMNAEQAHKNVCSGPEPLVLFLSLLLYLGFELSFRSMDFPADITLRKTRMKFELTFKVVLLFSYQGFVCSFFATQLLYFISFRSFCQEHGITPKTIQKAIRDVISITNEEAPEKSRGSLKKDTESMNRKELTEMIAKLTKKMNKAAAELNFEEAAELRDELKKYKIALRDYDD